MAGVIVLYGDISLHTILEFSAATHWVLGLLTFHNSFFSCITFSSPLVINLVNRSLRPSEPIPTPKPKRQPPPGQAHQRHDSNADRRIVKRLRRDRIQLRQQQHHELKHDIQARHRAHNHTPSITQPKTLPRRLWKRFSPHRMPRRNRDQVREISRNSRRGRDGAKRHLGANNGARDGHAEEQHQVRGVKRCGPVPPRIELAEVVGKGQHAVARDGKRYALGRHEARGGGAGGVDPEDDEDGDGGALAEELDEVFGPVVGIRGRDYSFEVLHAEEDHDKGLGRVVDGC